MSKWNTKIFLVSLLFFIITCGLCIHGIEAKEDGKKQIQKQNPATMGNAVVVGAVRTGKSLPLRDIARGIGPSQTAEPPREINPHEPRKLPGDSRPAPPPKEDPLRQKFLGAAPAPPPIINVEGQSDDENETTVGFRVVPPDTNGDVGQTQYVQWINLILSVYDKATGTRVLGPLPGNAIFAGFGAPCETTNNGDPTVLWDQFANRWVLSQFANPIGSGAMQCVAVSETSDATGAYFLYAFPTPGNDYPKMGVWGDAYYMTYRDFFQPSPDFIEAVALERDKMLVGDPTATSVRIGIPDMPPDFYEGVLPPHIEGVIPSQPGAPAPYVMSFDDEAFSNAPDPTQDFYKIWHFSVDFANPGNSQITGPISLPTAEMDIIINGSPFGQQIEQPPPGELLDGLSLFTMWRAVYHGATDTLWVNNTVNAGNDIAGIRWAEIGAPTSATPTVNQAGTFAPDDGNSRWMGSLAVDAAGNMALGYSVSSTSTMPSVRYAGRLVSDPPGILGQTETELFAGTGVQIGSASRWGDYSSMSIDESDGCTFWYTQEYYENTESFDFKTRIGSFQFLTCVSEEIGTLQGTVTDATNGNPIADATVEAVGTNTFSTTTDENGQYSMIVVADTYSVTASKFGYIPETVNGVVVTDGGTTTQDFALVPAPSATVSGTVTDGSGHGWPLYARIKISGAPISDIFTDPVTGFYSVDLPEGSTVTFIVNAVSAGYNPESREITVAPGGQVENFALTVNAGACIAPGYELVPDQVPLNEDFESGFGNWTMTGLWNPENEADPCGSLVAPFPSSSNDAYYGVDGGQCTFNNGATNSGTLTLVTPITIPATGSANLVFSSYEQTECGGPSCPYDGRFVDISTDGGATWTNIGEGDTENTWYQKTISLAAYSGTSALIRFRFDTLDSVANDFFGWMVDNITVSTATCTPIPGGLLVGNVFDLATGLGLNGATVTSDNQPEDTTTTFSTPDDPAEEEGFYILFSSLLGPQPFTASKSNFSPDTETVTVVADSVVENDFELGSGFLVVNPTFLEATVDLGGTATREFTITNEGTGAATFEIQEGNGHVTITAPDKNGVQGQGAPLKVIKGRFTPWQHGLAKSKFRAEPGDKGVSEGMPVPKAPPWVDIANYPTSIMDSTAAAIDELVYSVGGLDSNFNVLSSGFVYDPGTDSWSPIASMGSQREKPAAAAIDGLLYVVGGWDEFGTPDASLEIYDPGSNTWSTGASVPAAYGGGPAGVNLDGKFYVIGGCSSFSCGVTDVWVYDPGADSWSSAADYPEPTSWLACGNIGGQIFCAGGVSDALGESNNTYVYDPASDSWTQLADMLQTQWGMGYTVSDDLLYISGGVTDNFATVTNEGFVYDPSADSWSPIANSNNVVYRGASACGFYRIGGSIGGFTPVPDSEVLPGLTNCGGAADVPWLSESPTSGTLQPGESVIVTVTFDASVPEVTGPGDYLAHLTIKEDTPHPSPVVNVTMHVEVPSLSIADFSNTEGNSGIKMFPVTVSLSKAPLTNVSVDFSTADGTAEAGVDYVAKSGTLVIPAGQISGTININVIGDMDSEPDETFFVNLANATGAVITDPQAQVTILNDDDGGECPPITLDDTLPNGNRNKPYSGVITASGGTPPYTFAVTNGSLPPGLTLNADGTLTGTPTQGGTFNFEVTATDAADCTGSRLYTIVIKGKKK